MFGSKRKNPTEAREPNGDALSNTEAVLAEKVRGSTKSGRKRAGFSLGAFLAATALMNAAPAPAQAQDWRGISDRAGEVSDRMRGGEQRSAERRAERVGLREEIDSINRQIALIDAQLYQLQGADSTGRIPSPRTITLEAAEADGVISAVEQAALEYQTQVADIRRDFLESGQDAVAQARRDQQLGEAQERFQRRGINATASRDRLLDSRGRLIERRTYLAERLGSPFVQTTTDTLETIRVVTGVLGVLDR
ncbi:hypothetical protein K2X83_02070 [Patescibacteria group bacterium]|nr:hypothetical protein [Patescibacteria group bacterium]